MHPVIRRHTNAKPSEVLDLFRKHIDVSPPEALFYSVAGKDSQGNDRRVGSYFGTIRGNRIELAYVHSEESTSSILRIDIEEDPLSGSVLICRIRSRWQAHLIFWLVLLTYVGTIWSVWALENYRVTYISLTATRDATVLIGSLIPLFGLTYYWASQRDLKRLDSFVCGILTISRTATLGRPSNVSTRYE
jgi:hypothetical protein